MKTNKGTLLRMDATSAAVSTRAEDFRVRTVSNAIRMWSRSSIPSVRMKLPFASIPSADQVISTKIINNQD